MQSNRVKRRAIKSGGTGSLARSKVGGGGGGGGGGGARRGRKRGGNPEKPGEEEEYEPGNNNNPVFFTISPQSKRVRVSNTTSSYLT